ncbi:MAG: CDP-glycerol glycerophosphotransferase family protein [Methanobacteriaceae archaeon]
MIKYVEKVKKVKRISLRLLRDSFIIRYSKSPINNNSIFLESKNPQDGIAGSIFYILNELVKDKYSSFNIVLAVKNRNFEDTKKLLSSYNIENKVELLVSGTLTYYKKLFSAKYLFNDGNFPTKFFKRKSQVYFNTNDEVPFNYMGRKSKTPYSLGNFQRNLVMADYLLFSNDFMEETIINDLMIENISFSKIINAGFPKNSVFTDETNIASLRNKSCFNNKEIIIYWPSPRKLSEDEVDSQRKLISNYLSEIDRNLLENQVFYIKPNDIINEIDFSIFANIQEFPKEYEDYEFLSCADCLISDYSSVIFDFSYSKNKIILFPYDYEEYVTKNGIYHDLNDFPFPKAYTIEELLNEVNKEKEYNDKDFIETFCKYDCDNVAKYICNMVIFNNNNNNNEYNLDNSSDTLLIKDIPKNNKENVLIYSGNLSKNGLTSALLNLLSNIDLKKRNYFLTFTARAVKNHSKTISNLPPDIQYIPLSGPTVFNFKEYFSFYLFNSKNISNKSIKNQLDKLYNRNIMKFLPFNNFDFFIQFTGYNKIITSLFQRLNSKNIIFVHSDMLSEIKTRGNQHLLTLKEAYNKYDMLALVSAMLIKSTSKIKGDSNNLFLVNNSFDYESIIKKSNEKIEFDEDTESNKSIANVKNILNSDSNKFITIGRFSPEKGHIRLLKVFNNFYKNNKNSYLFIIGGHGVLYKDTLEYSKGLACAKNVIIIKSLYNPFPVLKKCDLFVLPSLYEGLGLVLLEADILGLKIFSTEAKGSKQFMETYNGKLVENSEKGILEGFQDFMDGKIKKLDINYEEYNKDALDSFEVLFN